MEKEMNGLNRAYLMGHVGQDPELRTTASGLPVLKLSMATPSARKVDDQWVDTPDWHRVTVFGKTAEWLSKVAGKGTVLGVECSIKPQKWTNKDGVTQHSVEFYVDKVLCCIPKNRNATQAATDVAAQAPPRGEEVAQDEIPF
jgi:single-strand DNA-binding protein